MNCSGTDKKEPHVPVYFKDLLQFITGADAIPPLGFKCPLAIIFYDQEETTVTRLPYASTCATNLALPRDHKDPTSFGELMSRSLFDSCGLGKA